MTFWFLLVNGRINNDQMKKVRQWEQQSDSCNFEWFMGHDHFYHKKRVNKSMQHAWQFVVWNKYPHPQRVTGGKRSLIFQQLPPGRHRQLQRVSQHPQDTHFPPVCSSLFLHWLFGELRVSRLEIKYSSAKCLKIPNTPAQGKKSRKFPVRHLGDQK